MASRESSIDDLPSNRPFSVQIGLIVALLLVSSILLISRWDSESGNDSEVYEIVEEMPELIGGLSGLQAKVTYPDIARKAHVEGRVIVQLVVDENGNGRDAEILRGAGAGLDEEAIRVIYEHAEFTPGRQDGKPVPVRVAIPIVFRLDNELESLSDQSQSSEKQDVYEIVEQMPELIGGIGALQAKVKYPEIAQKAHVEGRVVVQFIVDENGDVRDAEVVRGAGAGLDEEATRVIMEEAKFIPGHQSGRAVPTKTSLPIVFKLR